MNDIVTVKNLTVRFNRSTQKVDNLKEYFVKLVKRQLMFQEFFALKDITISIKKGDAVAIVGSNGSGKSTLLKAISGILKPYKGTVSVMGHIAPLIELGAGFDPNLSARENIFMNGVVLGHSRKYMRAHFDEIVEFAEISDFLDSPIKNYSSGMTARLGFAIATAVNPEILIVDEVLSVGDRAFKQKCEKRMETMLSNGATLILVSHSSDDIKKLCTRAVWINGGELAMDGDVESVCGAYMPEESV